MDTTKRSVFGRLITELAEVSDVNAGDDSLAADIATNAAGIATNVTDIGNRVSKFKIDTNGQSLAGDLLVDNLDASSATTMTVGGTTQTRLDLSRSGVETKALGDLNVVGDFKNNSVAA